VVREQHDVEPLQQHAGRERAEREPARPANTRETTPTAVTAAVVNVSIPSTPRLRRSPTTCGNVDLIAPLIGITWPTRWKFQPRYGATTAAAAKPTRSNVASRSPGGALRAAAIVITPQGTHCRAARAP
jgi:hypothetical protein